MKRRFIYSVTITALALNLFFGAQLYLQSAEADPKNDIYRQLRLFSLVLERVRQDYVDGADLSYQDLIYGALRGMLSTLDPHSEFLEPKRYDGLKEDTEGRFGGVGIQVGLRGGVLTVIAPIDDTPAARAGILSGDRIVKINGRNARDLNQNEAIQQLRGEPGTEVTITIERPSTGTERDITLKREKIRVDTVRDIHGQGEYPLGPDKIGYVRMSQFGESTQKELSAALKALESKGMTGLVLDVRDNPGGLLDQAAMVCEKFVPARTPIVSTQGRDPGERREYRATSRDKHLEVPLVVLVNGGSASASEIVAGCLQDLKRAVIVGEQTFGKGSVQSVIPLTDGSALRLTTAKYYTPSQKVIHEQGITPDIIVPMTAEETQAAFNRRQAGYIETLELEAREAALAAQDPQLDRAMELLKGITLFTARQNGAAKAPEAGKPGDVSTH